MAIFKLNTLKKLVYKPFIQWLVGEFYTNVFGGRWDVLLTRQTHRQTPLSCPHCFWQRAMMTLQNLPLAKAKNKQKINLCLLCAESLWRLFSVAHPAPLVLPLLPSCRSMPGKNWWKQIVVSHPYFHRDPSTPSPFPGSDAGMRQSDSSSKKKGKRFLQLYLLSVHNKSYFSQQGLGGVMWVQMV